MAQGLAVMIRIEAVWLALGVSDLRAGMDTLLGRVVHGFEGGAQQHHAYVFANRGATRLKVLVYDGAGLWLCTRRLQGGRFVWPTQSTGMLSLTRAQWDWLFAGAPWQKLDAPSSIRIV
jgi:transposase